MLIYLCLALFPIFLGALFPKVQENRKQKAYFYLICGAVMLVTMGLRHYSLGSTDTQNYYNAMVRAIRSRTWSEYYEPDRYEVGIQAFMYILSRFFKDPQWLLISTSLLFITSIFYFVDRNSDDIPLAICAYIALGLMQFHLQGMRQSLAMCICLFAYEQAKQRNPVKFLLLVLLATSFHQTAIVFYPVYFICQMQYSNRNLLLIAVVFGIALLFADQLVGFANYIFDREYTTDVDSGGFVATVIYCIVLGAALRCYSFHNEDARTPLVYILIMGLACYLVRYIGTVAAERISFYFVFSQLALLPNAIKLVVPRDRKIMHGIIVFLAVALFAYRLNGSDFIPYKFFWQ